ncbi:hypothetical protein CVV38_02695 [Candidatus Peregrinibacteria bacterium HGW-Peregrinibacteria-1]|jgi:hypothetical protein|nr:MAG: hypothetical protein CVV38_02695 [Candidatus Peregrinibacteria bacterium HGW-Peregrinibacteria-1]
MSNTDNLNLEELFKAMGIDDLPAEEKESIAAQFSDSVDEAVILRLADMLSEDEFAEFTDMEGDAADKYLTDRNIKLSDIAIEESVRLVEEFAMHVKNTQEVIDKHSSQ